ncbi:cytochrome P450 [Laetiporus sulphureus 93-53]|uniref:Cytochrome P450 n=1 Tax=Laetiporus sulphureus 93-53 TaxID=1314785 RepID=A0A165EZR6_9APHY|nr:cytochrome P450 [Laetiporus sulphureus 93-53]KZT08062.1 cytochrome P450 [Laetiporus sulphureus 93-53]
MALEYTYSRTASSAVLALVAHVLFNRYEPTSLPALTVILLLVPALPIVLSPLTSGYLGIQLFLSCLTYYSVLLLSIATYRLSSFYALHKYPGPIPCKLSKLWLVYVTYKGKQHEYFQKLHDQYGSIVPVGPNELSILDVGLLPHIMGTNGMPKGPVWDGRRALGKNGATSSDKGGLLGVRNMQAHAEVRTVWNRAFTTSAVKRYEPIIIRRASQLIEELKKRCVAAAWEGKNPEFDITKWVGYFSFDFMGDLVFGGGFEMLQDGDKSGVMHTIESNLCLPSLTQHIPWCLDIIYALPLFNQGPDDLVEFTYKQVMRRMKEGAVHDDLFYHISDEAKLEKEPPSFPVIMDSTLVAIIAGSDTVATTLSNTFYFLCSNPSSYSRLRAELDEAFPPGKGEPTNTIKLAQLGYLNAVINEALRLFPPVPTALQRAPTIGSGGHMLGTSLFIPEGTAVYVPPYALHRDPRYFSPDPNKFWPERWLVTDDPNIITNKNAFIPFSIGPSGCVGKPVAQIELRMILAFMLQAFDIRFAESYDKAQWTHDMQDFFIVLKGPLPVVLTPRTS